MNILRYRLILKKYRDFLLPTLHMTTANNLTTFVDTLLVSAFLGVDRVPAVQLCFPTLILLNKTQGSDH